MGTSRVFLALAVLLQLAYAPTVLGEEEDSAKKSAKNIASIMKQTGFKSSYESYFGGRSDFRISGGFPENCAEGSYYVTILPSNQIKVAAMASHYYIDRMKDESGHMVFRARAAKGGPVIILKRDKSGAITVEKGDVTAEMFEALSLVIERLLKLLEASRLTSQARFAEAKDAFDELHESCLKLNHLRKSSHVKSIPVPDRPTTVPTPSGLIANDLILLMKEIGFKPRRQSWPGSKIDLTLSHFNEENCPAGNFYLSISGQGELKVSALVSDYYIDRMVDDEDDSLFKARLRHGSMILLRKPDGNPSVDSDEQLQAETRNVLLLATDHARKLLEAGQMASEGRLTEARTLLHQMRDACKLSPTISVKPQKKSVASALSQTHDENTRLGRDLKKLLISAGFKPSYESQPGGKIALMLGHFQSENCAEGNYYLTVSKKQQIKASSMVSGYHIDSFVDDEGTTLFKAHRPREAQIVWEMRPSGEIIIKEGEASKEKMTLFLQATARQLKLLAAGQLASRGDEDKAEKILKEIRASCSHEIAAQKISDAGSPTPQKEPPIHSGGEGNNVNKNSFHAR